MNGPTPAQSTILFSGAVVVSPEFRVPVAKTVQGWTNAELQKFFAYSQVDVKKIDPGVDGAVFYEHAHEIFAMRQFFWQHCCTHVSQLKVRLIRQALNKLSGKAAVFELAPRKLRPIACSCCTKTLHKSGSNELDKLVNKLTPIVLPLDILAGFFVHMTPTIEVIHGSKVAPNVEDVAAIFSAMLSMTCELLNALQHLQAGHLQAGHLQAGHLQAGERDFYLLMLVLEHYGPCMLCVLGVNRTTLQGVRQFLLSLTSGTAGRTCDDNFLREKDRMLVANFEALSITSVAKEKKSLGENEKEEESRVPRLPECVDSVLASLDAVVAGVFLLLNEMGKQTESQTESAKLREIQVAWQDSWDYFGDGIEQGIPTAAANRPDTGVCQSHAATPPSPRV